MIVPHTRIGNECVVSHTLFESVGNATRRSLFVRSCIYGLDVSAKIQARRDCMLVRGSRWRQRRQRILSRRRATTYVSCAALLVQYYFLTKMERRKVTRIRMRLLPATPLI